jgi:glutamate synthase domain-containing protein 3
MRIDARGVHYRELNARIRASIASGESDFVLDNVEGQRYIGAGLGRGVNITIDGIPGNDLAAFMNGASITVSGNAQDGVGNTMNAGRVVIHGSAGDILGHSMRGGRIFVRGSVGYRTGIHMKAYAERLPAVVIGGRAGDYLGEYMAGGVIVVLGLHGNGTSPVREYVGTGMHGGAIYIRGPVEDYQLGREVGIEPPGESDWTLVGEILRDFCTDLKLDGRDFRPDEFVKLAPKSTRPYGTLYAY